MLTLFRINSVFLGLVLLGLLVVLRIPFFGDNFPLLSVDIEYQLIGEKLNLDLNMYNEVFSEVAPLSAFVYKIIDFSFGKSLLAYEIAAGIFIMFQIWYFVYMLNKRNIFNEKNFIPGLIYFILVHISFDLLKLTPSLMGNTFVLLSLNSVLRQLEKRDLAGEDVLESGLFLGIAVLFDISNFILIFWVLISLFFFTSTTLRQGFTVILSFILPIFIAYIIYSFRGASQEFLSNWLFNLKPNFKFSWLSLKDLLLVFSVPLLLGAVGILRVFSGIRYNNFQFRSHQIILLMSIFSLLTIFVANDLMPSSLYTFIIPVAFFVSGFFIHQKTLFLPELLFVLFSIFVIGFMFSSTRTTNQSLQALNKYRVITEENKLLAGKRIFVTGFIDKVYENSTFSTGYLSWNLAKSDFKNPHNFNNVIKIYNNFSKDMPQVIIDKEKVMPEIFKKIPQLGHKYRKEGDNYFLK